MCAIFLASNNARKYIESLAAGICLDFDESDNIPVLMIKLEASLQTSILLGCPIKLIIRNPLVSPRTITVVLLDDPDQPYYANGVNLGTEHEQFKHFDENVIALTRSKQVRVALYNENGNSFFTTVIDSDIDTEQFQRWLSEVYRNPDSLLIEVSETGLYYPETNLTGFQINLKNFDHSDESKFILIETETNNIGKPNPYSIMDYLNDGKHGYNQEISIKNYLLNYFDKPNEVWISVLQKNETEITDFLVLLENAAILIESKYVISDKPTKKMQSLVKAIDQLNKASEIICRGVPLYDDKLETKLSESTRQVIKICMLNDKILITEKQAAHLRQTYSKHQLPIFISPSIFFQLVASLKIRNQETFRMNLVSNLENQLSQFIEGDKNILQIRQFRTKWDGGINGVKL